MPTITWDDALVIDGSQIDFQHRQLVEAMGDLEDALQARDAARIANAMPFLRLYAKDHFADEERVLALIGWPTLDEHRQLHQGFSRRLDDLESTVSRGEHAAGAELLRFLARWLVGHIRGSDREFAAEVRQLRQR